MASVNSHLYLDPEQQDLLLAALASNSPMFQYHHNLDGVESFPNSSKNAQMQSSGASPSGGSHNNVDMNQPTTGLTDFTTPLSDFNTSPVLDGLEYSFDLDGSYDWDQGMGEDYNPSVDDSADAPASTEHEKRKSPPTDNEDGTPGSDTQGDPKRRGWLLLSSVTGISTKF